MFYRLWYETAQWSVSPHAVFYPVSMTLWWNGMMQPLSPAHKPLCVTGRLGREKNKAEGRGWWEKRKKRKEALLLCVRNRPLARRAHVTNASFTQGVGILVMPKIDRAYKSYLTPEIWEATHLSEIFYGTLIFQQSSMISLAAMLETRRPKPLFAYIFLTVW